MPPHFLSLPRELRDIIYDSLLLSPVDNTNVTLEGHGHDMMISPFYDSVVSPVEGKAYRSCAFNLSLVCHQIRAELLDRCKRIKTKKPRYVLTMGFEDPLTRGLFGTTVMRWEMIPLYLRPYTDVLEVHLLPSSLPLGSEDFFLIENHQRVWDVIAETIWFGPKPAPSKFEKPPAPPEMTIGTLRFVTHSQPKFSRWTFPFVFDNPCHCKLRRWKKRYHALRCIDVIELCSPGQRRQWNVKDVLGPIEC